MAPLSRSEGSGPGRPNAHLAVEPFLLSSTLSRLLRSRGWAVTADGPPTTAASAAASASAAAAASVGRGEGPGPGAVDALIVSPGRRSGSVGVEAAVTIVLPDESGAGGLVLHPDGRSVRLDLGADGLEGLLGALRPS